MKSNRGLCLSWILVGSLAAGALVECSSGDHVLASVDCTDNGVAHANGDAWAASDGCNTSTCNNGVVTSTQRMCTDAGTIACTYNGTVHANGTTWTCSDGCNTCSCTDGQVGTTLVACLASCNDNGTVHPSGSSWTCSDGCNSCSCDNGDISATLMGCGVQDAAADACPDPVCTGACAAGYVYGTEEVNGCPVCSCVLPDAGSSSQDASLDACPEQPACALPCPSGYTSGTHVVDGCPVCECVPADAGPSPEDAALDACPDPVCPRSVPVCDGVVGIQVYTGPGPNNGCALCGCWPADAGSSPEDAALDACPITCAIDCPIGRISVGSLVNGCEVCACVLPDAGPTLRDATAD